MVRKRTTNCGIRFIRVRILTVNVYCGWRYAFYRQCRITGVYVVTSVTLRDENAIDDSLKGTKANL